ncbi:MAG: hypothetical protein ACM34K_17140, partial [Bacillota bacterium]
DTKEYLIVSNLETLSDETTGKKTTVLNIKNKDNSNIDLTGILLQGKMFAEIHNNSISVKYTLPIILYKKPQCKYDFYAIFLNKNGVPAKINGTNLVSYKYEVNFDGIPDFDQLIEVHGLSAANLDYDLAGVDDIDDVGFVSKQGFQAVPSLSGWFCELSFDDLKLIPRQDWNDEGFRTAKGNPVKVSFDQARRILDYVVYMFISETNQPPDYARPGLNEGEQESQGRWFHMGYFKDTNVKVRCMPDSYVAFWVGFRMKPDTLPVAESVINELPKY